MSFVLYIPGAVAGDKQQRLREVGLEAFAGDNVPTLEIKELVPPGESGPDGGYGLLLRLCHGAKSPLDPPLTYRPDLQEWTPCQPDPARELPAGRYWMGRATCSPLPAAAGEGPGVRGFGADRADRADLTEAYCRRPRTYDSYPVTLLDGQPWLVPVARGLPQWLQIDERGEWVQRVKTEFQAYWDESEALFAAALAGVAYRLDFALPFVLRGLALNYCLTPDLASWLGLLDDAVVMQAAGCALEIEQVRAIVAAKKKRDEEQQTGDRGTAKSEPPSPGSPSPEPGSPDISQSVTCRVDSTSGPGRSSPEC